MWFIFFLLIKHITKCSRTKNHYLKGVLLVLTCFKVQALLECCHKQQQNFTHKKAVQMNEGGIQRYDYGQSFKLIISNEY